MNKNSLVDGLNDFTTTIEGKIKISKDISITGNYTHNLENGLDMYRGVRLSYSLYLGIVEQVPVQNGIRHFKETTSTIIITYSMCLVIIIKASGIII